MSEVKKMSGLALATAAATLFMAGCASSGAAEQEMKSEAMVHCFGINSCKGQTSCKSANNSCKGQNSCKGHGWMPTSTKEECTEKGGTVG